MDDFDDFDNVTPLRGSNAVPQGKVASWIPKHLDEKMQKFLDRNPHSITPMEYLFGVLNGKEPSATVEEKMDAAFKLLPYFHSKAPVLEIEDLKNAVTDNTKAKANMEAKLEKLLKLKSL